MNQIRKYYWGSNTDGGKVRVSHLWVDMNNKKGAISYCCQVIDKSNLVDFGDNRRKCKVCMQNARFLDIRHKT